MAKVWKVGDCISGDDAELPFGTVIEDRGGRQAVRVCGGIMQENSGDVQECGTLFGTWIVASIPPPPVAKRAHKSWEVAYGFHKVEDKNRGDA